MKALVLAAGYAVRLHPLTVDQPKPLLKIKEKPILEYILTKLQAVKAIDEIFIVTNHRFHDQFRLWLNHYQSKQKITLINDGTLRNEDRLGAVGDINFVLKEQDFKDDLMVIAGDNIFGFSLLKFADFFRQKQKSVVAFHDFKDPEKIKGKFGVGFLNHSQIVQFEEKPLQPKTSLAATACYIFHKQDLPLIEKSLTQGKADNPGDLIKFLVKHSEVHGFVFTEHWFDVGSFESLKAAEEAYS